MPRRRRPPRDPLLPLREREIRQQARGQTMPLARELGRMLEARAAAGARNIEGVTNRLASSLGGYEQRVGDIYGKSREQLGALNQQVGSAISAAGQQGASALAERLRLSGGDPSLAAALGTAGAGASAAAQAYGGAELAQLISNEASGRTYAASLPGIAKLGGLQGIRELQARKQQDLAEGMSDIRSRIPGVERDIRDREVQKAVALRTFGLDEAKLYEESRQFEREQSQDARQKALDRREDARQKALDRQADAREAAADRAQAEREAASKGRQVDMAQSRARGYYVDKQGRPVLSKKGGRIWLPEAARDTGKAKERARDRAAYGNRRRPSGDSPSGAGAPPPG